MFPKMRRIVTGHNEKAGRLLRLMVRRLIQSDVKKAVCLKSGTQTEVPLIPRIPQTG